MTVSARKAKVFLWTSLKITGTHMLTSCIVSSASPLLLFHLHSSPGHGVMTFHNYCYSCNSRLPLFYIPEVERCFHCFLLRYNHSRNTVVRTKNSERLIESYNTLRNDAPHTFMHCSCGWIFRAKRNEWHRKMMHMGKIDRGFTAIEAYKFLMVVACSFCHLQ